MIYYTHSIFTKRYYINVWSTIWPFICPPFGVLRMHHLSKRYSYFFMNLLKMAFWENKSKSNNCLGDTVIFFDFLKKIKKKHDFLHKSVNPMFYHTFLMIFDEKYKKNSILLVLTKKPNKSSNVICVLFFHVLGRHFEICGVFLIKNGKLHRRWNGHGIQTC